MPFRLRHLQQHVLSRLSAMLPNSCVLCGTAGRDLVCAGCHGQFFCESPVRCLQCAARLPPGAHEAQRCGVCLRDKPAFDATIVAADYAAPIDQLVLALKFGKRLALAPLFAQLLRDAVKKTAVDELPGMLVAMPIGAQRLADRGFNQALEIAKPLSRKLKTRLDTKLLTRTRETRPQAMLHPDERQKNVRRAFIVPAAAIERVKGQHIGIVDDVITTGATLDEVAATLKRFGAIRVTNLIFARPLH